MKRVILTENYNSIKSRSKWEDTIQTDEIFSLSFVQKKALSPSAMIFFLILGVSLEQWAKFSIFLNNLEEFTTAVRLYTNADIPVSPEEFTRAVESTIGRLK